MAEMKPDGFERVAGQRRVKALLASALEKNRLPHALLFTGPPGIGKDAMAVALGLGFVCENRTPGGCGTCSACARRLRLEDPGFRFVHPVPTRPKSMKEEKYFEVLRERGLARIRNPYRSVTFAPELTTAPVIGIDAIRALRQESRLMLFGGGMRVILISRADAMTVPAANSLLKLLEEPPEDTVILLTSPASGLLLPTIVSRCQTLRMDRLNVTEIEEALVRRWETPPDAARLIARMSGGSLDRALELADGDFEWRRDCAFQALRAMVERDPVAQIDGFDALLKNTDKTDFPGVLQMLLALLRDLQQIRLGREDLMLDSKAAESLASFLRENPDLDIDRAARSVLRAIDFGQKNVYLPLVLYSLDQVPAN
jgi:DNA polymerase III subunit delta'